MSKNLVKLCPRDCEFWHSKEDVADILGVSLATVYNYIKDGLKEGRRGTIYCPWIREYWEGKHAEKPVSVAKS